MVFKWDVAVNYTPKPGELESNQPRRHPLVTALAVVLGVEALAIAAAAVFLLVEIAVAPATSVGSALALAVIVSITAVWVGFIVAGVLRGQAWTRAAVIVVQALLAAVAIGSLQGPSPRVDLAIALLVPVVASTLLLFQKPVLAATTGRSSGDEAF